VYRHSPGRGIGSFICERERESVRERERERGSHYIKVMETYLKGQREDQFKRTMEVAAAGNKCRKGPVEDLGSEPE
jgi:hypothetical protein